MMNKVNFLMEQLTYDFTIVFKFSIVLNIIEMYN